LTNGTHFIRTGNDTPAVVGCTAQIKYQSPLMPK